jgi:hypothetical protein
MKMRVLPTVCAFSLLFFTTTGCITGRVAEMTGDWQRGHCEVLTATSAAVGTEGTPFAVVALENQCRIAPGDPEGGPGARSYTLSRVPATPDEDRFLEKQQISFVRAYRSSSLPEHEAPAGFPDSVLLGEKGGDPRLFLKTPDGWSQLPVTRYVHESGSTGHPVLATIVAVVLVPPAMAIDLVTWPIQWWFIAPWFPLAPK